MGKIVRLENFNINLGCGEMTPFFQSEQNKRIRFGLDELGRGKLQEIIDEIFEEHEAIELVFISEYISSGKRILSKAKIGKIISIRNWKETLSLNADETEGGVYANVKNLNRTDVYNYCFAIKKGFREAYIVFYSDAFLLYVSSDVIDIISNNESEIKKLKEAYAELYDKCYEIN